jgi:uncharacterized membrane protein
MDRARRKKWMVNQQEQPLNDTTVAATTITDMPSTTANSVIASSSTLAVETNVTLLAIVDQVLSNMWMQDLLKE